MHDIDLRLLRVFRAIVDAGGISSAQGLLDASQSTLSTQLSELERRLGFRVCQRGRRGFALTEEGRHLLAAMDDLFVAADRFRNAVADISGELRGVLRIGVMDAMLSNSAWPLTSVVGAFSAIAPETEVDLTLVAPGEMEDMLLDGRRDCAIGPFPHRRPGLTYLPIYQERHSLYALRGHPITLEPDAGPDLLGRHALIVTAAELQRFPFIRNGLRRGAGGSVQVSAAADQMETHIIKIRSGRFVGFLPDYLGLAQPDLVAVSDRPDLQYHLPICTAFREHADAGIILRRFLDCVQGQPLLEGDLTRSGAVVPMLPS